MKGWITDDQKGESTMEFCTDFLKETVMEAYLSPLQSAEVSYLLEKGNISGNASFLIEMKSKQGGYMCFQYQGV
jgi:hypothetical protein